MKKFVIVLLMLACGVATVLYASNDRPKIKYASQFKKQAKSLAENHQWVSFKYRNIHYWDGKQGWDVVVSVIIRYSNDNPLVFIDIEDNNFYLLTKSSYKRINDLRMEITDVRKGRDDKSDLYQNIGVLGIVPSALRNVSYFIRPVDFVNTWAVRPFVTNCSEVKVDGKPYNRYESFFMRDESIVSFVNNVNNVLDSVYVEYHSNDGHEAKDYYSIFDVGFEDRQQYIDSVFDFGKSKYIAYSRYDESTFPTMAENTDSLTTDILNFPLVNIQGDTTTLSKQDGWLLLNFWTLSCKPCLESLQGYGREKDSLGYRILENEDIGIMAIEHKSNNMELIGDIADKTKCGDIMYSAKGIGTKISIPFLGFYYLISPSKEIVGKYDQLDYTKILKAKQEYESE